MREIKFRAWDKSNCRFLSMPLVGIDFENNCVNSYEVEQVSDTEYVQIQNTCFKYELMQFTGLKDKKSVEIYEGDIVIEKSYPFFGNAPEITSSNQKCDELNYVGVVVWDNGYYVDLRAISDRVKGIAMGHNLYDYKELEVIGNIYENSELFKES